MIEARSEHARFLPRLPFETLPPSSLRNGARAVSGAVKHANLRVPAIPARASLGLDDEASGVRDALISHNGATGDGSARTLTP